MDPTGVLVRREGGAGWLTLARPQTLNALTLPMCEAMSAALLDWRDDPTVTVVLLDHEGERGFCAGGDVRAAAGDPKLARRFFMAEYRLNALMCDYPKPIVAFMDGITMGGGVGLARPARYRVSTERTVWAMPEAAIGLFPDVGGGWWLSRLPGAVGLWLALTGARLGPADCLLLGFATDHAASSSLPALKAAIVAEPAAIETHLAEHEADAGEPPLALVRDDIDRLFGRGDVEDILQALHSDGGPWAETQAAILKRGSPTTLKAAARLIEEGANAAGFSDEMRKEYRLAVRISSSHDFAEGVRAVLVDKDGAPRWRPATLSEVDDGDLDALFAPLPDSDEWTPLL
jgi:enoyl-CoA hydratase